MLVDAIRAEGFRLSKNRTALFWSLGFVPLVVGVGADNEGYLSTKRDRMGHELPDSITSAPVFTTLEGRTA